MSVRDVFSGLSLNYFLHFHLNIKFSGNILDYWYYCAAVNGVFFL